MSKEKEQEQEQQVATGTAAPEAPATVPADSSAGKQAPTVIEGTTRDEVISLAQAAIGNAAKKGERLCASPIARDCTSGHYVIRLTKL